MPKQRPITDLIPKSHGFYWGFALASLVMMGLLGFGFLHASLLSEKLGLQQIPPLNLLSGGSLFRWWMSLLWLASACVGLLIRSMILQEREESADRAKNAGLKNQDVPDDGRRPRLPDADIWLWGALAAFFLSIDETVRFRELLRDFFIRHGGVWFDENGNYWWISCYILVFFGLIGTRLIAQTKRDLVTLHFLLVSLLFFIVSGTVSSGFAQHLPLLLGIDDQETRLSMNEFIVLGAGAQMAGTSLVLLALALFARRLILVNEKQTERPAASEQPPKKESKVEDISKPDDADDLFDLATPVPAKETPVKSRTVTVGGKQTGSQLSAEELARLRRK